MLNSPLPPDVTVTDRLQTVIADWKGAQAGHPLQRLYQDCLDLVGQEKLLLPIKMMAVRELDSESLDRTLKRYRMPLEYDIDTVGRFEAAMVPVLRESGPAAGFFFAYEEELSGQDQVALFAHAIGHLILNHQQRLKEQELPLDPESGEIHTDRLAELRYLDIAKNRNLLDRQVLDAFPKLTEMIELPEESQIKLETATRALEPLLRRQGWVGHFVRMPYRYTRGRIIPNSQQRGRCMTIDAQLRAQASLPIAVVHVQRPEEKQEEAIGRVRHATQRLCIPFAYILTQQKEIIELHWLSGSLSEPQVQIRTTLPNRAELQTRWLSVLQLTDPKEEDTIIYPYDLTQQPRYYQEIAINQAIIAVLQARKGLRERRILLTLATGTGKTQIAFQILWKLKKTHRVRNVLFLADRGYLLDQAKTNAFAPFGEAIVRGMGEIDTAHDILFGTYQWLTTVQDGEERYKGYPADYFDVIIIDECHRGSADDKSNWRKILGHFSEAIQIGLTATPLETEDVQTNKYFGPSVYTYTLSQGINDGFLAPYSVRRVLIEKEELTSGQPTSLPAHKPLETLDQQIVMQTGNTMRQYTQTIAAHLSRYLQLQADPRTHKTIVFCVDNDHADQMRIALESTCASWTRAGDIVRIVDDDGTEGKRALSQFCTIRERQPVIVTTARLLTTGVDVPTCKAIVLARGVGSIVEFKQIIGRGTRLSEPEKSWFTIIDYAGTIKHFSDPAFDGDPTSVQREYLLPPLPVPASDAEQTAQERALLGPPALDNEQGTLASHVQAEPLANGNQELTVPGNSHAVYDFRIAKEYQPDQETKSSVLDEASSPKETCSGEMKKWPVPDSNLHLQSHFFSSPSCSQDHHSFSDEHNATMQPEPPLDPYQADQSRLSANQTTMGTVRHADQSPADVPLVPESTRTPRQAQQAKKASVPKAVAVTIEKANGHRFVVSGEFAYELDASGKKLRAGTHQEFAQKALRGLIKTPDDLRTYWTDKQQRKLLIELLASEVVALDALAQALHLPDVDHYDLLQHVLFQQPTITRQERIQRLRSTHSPFFQRFEQNLLAKELLDAILEKYIQGDAPDVSDIGLLAVPPLNTHTRMEWVNAFKLGSPATNINTVLKELQQLLYSV